VPVTVAVVLGGVVAESDTAPFTIPVTVPARALGPTKLIAIGIDATDHSLVSNLVTLNVQTAQISGRFTSSTRTRSVGIARAGSSLCSAPTTTASRVTSRRPRRVPCISRRTRRSSPCRRACADLRGARDRDRRGAERPRAGQHHRDGAGERGADRQRGRRCRGGLCLAGATIPVHLDGSRSFDPDADPLTFTWSEAGSPIATGPTRPCCSRPGPTPSRCGLRRRLARRGLGRGHGLRGHRAAAVDDRGGQPGDHRVRTALHDRGATALDTCAGDLTAAITTRSNVNTACRGATL